MCSMNIDGGDSVCVGVGGRGGTNGCEIAL